MSNYSAKDIISIKNDRDRIRKRPTTYIPNKSLEGALHTIFEVIDNSLDEAKEQHRQSPKESSIINIVFDEDTKNVTITDMGRGIPEEKVIDVLTVINTSSKFDNNENTAYAASGGTNGVGLKLAVFLSKYFKIITTHRSKRTTCEFEDGHLKSKETTKGKGQGTMITFTLDPKQIETKELTYSQIKDMVRAKSYIFPYVKFDLTKIEGEKEAKKHSFFGEGLVEGTKKMNPDLPIITINDKVEVTTLENAKPVTDKVGVSVAFSMKDELVDTKDANENIVSFVNSIQTTTGGEHVEGLKEGLKDFFKDQFPSNSPVKPMDVIAGLCGYVVVDMSRVEFRGQFKDALNSPAGRKAVRQAVVSGLKGMKETQLKKYKDFITDIAKAREASKDVRTKKKKQRTAFDVDADPKFMPITETEKTYVRELYLTEGDSALGPITSSRDVNIHAVYPLKKAKNIIDNTNSQITSMDGSFNDLMNIIGVTPGKKPKRDDILFDKIIFALDADIDGHGMTAAHLAILAKFVPELFRWGLIYRLVPPLYKFESKKGKVFLSSQKDLNKWIIDEYVAKNTVTYSTGDKVKKKEIARLLERNFSYSKELDRLSKDMGVPALILERIIWFYNPKVEYNQKDVEYFKGVLEKKNAFSEKVYADVTYDKNDGIIISGEYKRSTFHLILNKYFNSVIETFKATQDQNLALDMYCLNDERKTIYGIMKSLEEFLPKDIHRIKGLGELDSKDFESQCMNHKNRRLLRMNLSNNFEADMEIIYRHHSKKKKYSDERAELLVGIVATDDMLDT